MKASVPAPNSASTSSVACQSSCSTRKPPSSGLPAAMKPSPPSARDMTRAPSPGSNRSRTTERPEVTAAAIATPCSARQAISVSTLAAAAPPNRLAIV